MQGTISKLEKDLSSVADEVGKRKINLQLFASKKKLQEISERVIKANSAPGDINTASKKFSYNNKSKKTGNLWERVRKDFVDRVAPLERLEKDVTGGIASAESSLYKQARLFEGLP